MTDADFAAFLARNIPDYAADKVAAGTWSEAEALERSRAEHEGFLPAGLATPGQHLFTIRDAADGQKVGAIWLAEMPGHAVPLGFILDLFIEEPFRRRGYARAAMLALEEVAQGLGLQSLALHVFGRNRAALPLYESLGYQVTDINMAKPLNTTR